MANIYHSYVVEKGDSPDYRKTNQGKWYVVHYAQIEGERTHTINDSWSFDTKEEAVEFAKKKSEGK